MRLTIDLRDVPPQAPILKVTQGQGASKYQGVSYDNEEEAAVDYARAEYKYRKKATVDVPSQPQPTTAKSLDDAEKDRLFVMGSASKYHIMI
eukprot:scaffold3797_cov91-Skeletonema_dohrnii-CCMP3373.AAC.11